MLSFSGRRNIGVPVAIGGVHVTNDGEKILDDIPAATTAFAPTDAEGGGFDDEVHTVAGVNGV